MPIALEYTKKDYDGWRERRARYDVDNHPERNSSNETFFDALMSDEADITKGDFISSDALKLLGE